MGRKEGKGTLIFTDHCVNQRKLVLPIPFLIFLSHYFSVESLPWPLP